MLPPDAKAEKGITMDKQNFKNVMNGLCAYGDIDRFTIAQSIYLGLINEGITPSFDLSGASLKDRQLVVFANGMTADTELVYGALRCDYAAAMVGAYYDGISDVAVAPDHKNVVVMGRCICSLDDADLLDRVDKILEKCDSVVSSFAAAKEAIADGGMKDCADADDRKCGMTQMQ